MSKGLEWLPKPFSVTNNTYAENFLKLAYGYANTESPDPNTRNGAVIVCKNNRIISYSSNRFPCGVAETRARLDDQQTKYRMIIHAENGAVFNAARLGKSTKDSTLYCPFYSCSECAKAIIQAGITEVVGHVKIMGEHMPEHWIESTTLGWQMLQEAGVKCSLFDGTIGLMARIDKKDIEV